MKKYATQGLSGSGTANKTAITLVSGATFRALLSEYTVGVRTNPNTTDQQVEYGIGSWATSAGTSGSAPTPKPLDLVDPIAALVTTGITHSAEPTYDATLYMDTDINQRGAFRFVAEIGFEFAATAATVKGIGGKMIGVTAALAISMPFHHKE